MNNAHEGSYHADLYISRTLPGKKNRIERGRRESLTDREQETLLYMAAGCTSDEIGVRLFISTATVVSHRKNIIKKLGVPNIAAAVAHALRNNLIS